MRAGNVAELVGRTPLVRLTGVTRDLPPTVRVWAKLEGFNPGGSVKDRPALRMLQEGLRTGALRPGKVIIDSTSGNTGIALAMMGAALGYPVHLVIPGNVSVERRQIIEAYGAVAIESDPLEGSDGAIRHCREVIQGDPERYFKPDQYFNPANPLAHYETTGPEIWQQTGGRITHFLAGIGTSGTVMGTGRFLKEKSADVQILAVEPDDSFHGLEGLKHMASSIVPGIYDEPSLDGKVPVSTEDAYDMVYRLGREDGFLVGQSAGGACWAALEVAKKLDHGDVVTVFPDFGEKYLSTTLWAGWADIGPAVHAV